MQPPLERPVSFRLSAQAHRRYELAAARSGKRLSQYIRHRLETDDAVAEHVSQLRLALLDSGLDTEPSEMTQTIVLELLLLIRRTTAPGDIRAVHHEMARIGTEPWSPATS